MNFYQDELDLAFQTGVFRGARFSSFPTKDEGRDEKRAPLKTPAWEAKLDPAEHTKEGWSVARKEELNFEDLQEGNNLLLQ